MSGALALVATYRLQLNRQFGFADARRLVPLLKSLGISHLYVSPIFQARRGSLHGYDVVDPSRINPELGGRRELDRLTRVLRAHNMGLLLDVVPNHMAASWEDPWWWDVLENGSSSRWAELFDIDWAAGDGKLLLPVLGSPLEEILTQGELRLAIGEDGCFLKYFDARFPLDPSSYPTILDFILARDHPSELAQLARAFGDLPTRVERAQERVARRRKEATALRHRLWELYAHDAAFKDVFDAGIHDFERLGSGADSLYVRLLGEQAYQLSYWRTASSRINYRRFFDVTDLVGVRVETPAVFDATHRLLRELAASEQFQAVRIDHIDGLYDPGKYLERLQASLRQASGKDESFPVWVEKILGENEEIPHRWPVEGTSGYDALNSLNGVFVDPNGLGALRGIYTRFIGDWTSWDNIVYRQKKTVLEKLFGAELTSLTHSFKLLAERAPGAKSLSRSALRGTMVESIACLPVYRTYIRSFRVAKSDRRWIEMALRESLRRRPRQDRKAWLFLRQVLLLRSRQKTWLDFVRRWQQLTGPVMAKGFEDTALYRYHRLLSLNEVGGDPAGSYAALEDFHRRNRSRRRRWPRSLVATSTHDTKRSEDVRARINVISERPERWRAALNRWARWNRAHKQTVDGQVVPSRREEVFFYQTLLGAWPLTALTPDTLPAFQERLCEYWMKAAREAKRYTDWLEPNEGHEQALVAFARAVVDPSKSGRFLDDFQRLSENISFAGALNSLGQVLLKITAPGVPDFYQGTLLWNFRLVDPDNRRPVDFEKRAEVLDQLPKLYRRDVAPELAPMLSNWKDGSMKLFTIHRGLAFRASTPELFLSGDYIALRSSGSKRRHLCAFARRQHGRWAVAVVPRFTSRLMEGAQPPLGNTCWKKTLLHLPGGAPQRWENVLTGETVVSSRSKEHNVLHMSETLRVWPVALLAGPPP